jgi:hypothetical protein
MTKQFISSFISMVVVISSGYAVARGKVRAADPCTGVRKACATANNSDKDKTTACIETIKGGGTVDEVNPASNDVASCQASASK